MKPLGRKNYGSIPHLSNSKLGPKDHMIEMGQEKILTEKKRDDKDLVLVFEKYDGSNVGVAKKQGNIYALTRSGYEATTSRHLQHHEFAKWVGRRFDMFYSLLDEGERVTGEWLYQVHGLKYEIEGEPIVFFDYFSADNERQPYEYLCQLGLPLPRLLNLGNSVSVEKILPELNKKTNRIKSIEKPEGMVYRVERQGRVDFLAKWVRPDFIPGKYCIGIEDKRLMYNVKL